MTRQDREDIAAVLDFRRKFSVGEEELVPSSMVNCVLGGENKVRVWREYRGFSKHDLARRARVSAAYLQKLEAGPRCGNLSALKRVAAALGLSMDDLI